jgi:AraC-like DNA-binding protein
MSCAGLERSSAGPQGGWLECGGPVDGLARLRARLHRDAYTRHRHDTYTIALTESGVQEFSYLGGVHRSLPGQVVVLHPDEPHDGRPGTAEGFAYRSLYVDPARVLDAVQAAHPGRPGLPFLRQPVLTSPALARAVACGVDAVLEPLQVDALVASLAAGLLAASGAGAPPLPHRGLDRPALQRVRDHLSTHWARVVRSQELEQVGGLPRFELYAQFRQRYGTSPYRFLLMRRLEHVRTRLAGGAALADLAAEAGFADQAHMTRAFKAAFGMTPRRFAVLQGAAAQPAGTA